MINFDPIGKLMCVDKTKSIFLQDALEVIDRSAKAEEECRYLHHELFAHLLAEGVPTEQSHVLKYMGNVVIPGKHVKSIKLDKRLQGVYEEAEQKIKDKKQTDKDT